jgi:S1-C subfamily serine protease
MTNAHVVSWAKQIVVRRYQDPRPYPAKVVFIGHDCDLALLEVDSERFFDGMEPLEIGELPKVRSSVVTYGYPAGGEQISYTRGVVSRIEVQFYVHIGNRSFLAGQTDASINPGNSGGPVIQDDKVAGVAFQGAGGLENTGFFIPPPVIQHFLKDTDDGRYDGFPQAGIRLAGMQNPAYRKFLHLPDNDLGGKIDRVLPSSPAAGLLQEDDVLLQVGAYPVGSDCTIVYQGNRAHASTAFGEAQNGEKFPMKILRDGKPLDLSVPLQTMKEDLAEGNQYSVPKYYIFGGLVFTPLSRDYLKTFGANWADAASSELIYSLFYQRQELPALWRPEAVVVSSILSHPVNANLAMRSRAMVDSVNGVRVETMEDIVRAFESNTNTHDAIEFVGHRHLECLDHNQAIQASPEILKTYGVAQDRRL